MSITYSGTVSSNGIKTTKRKNTVLYFLDPIVCELPSNIIMSSMYTSDINYEVDEYVTYNNKLYKCIKSHISTSIFDINKWDKLLDKTIPISSFILSSYNNTFTFSIGEEHCRHNMNTEKSTSYTRMNIDCITIYEQNIEFELNGQF